MKTVATPVLNVTKNKRSAGITRGGKITPLSSIEIHVRINDIKKGYPIDKFDKLKDDLGVTGETLAKIANISLTTMHRRKVSSGRLTPDESDKIYRIEKLYGIALDVLENKESARVWFNTSQLVFESKTPLEYADTLPGSEEVERVLRRMEHGIIL